MFRCNSKTTCYFKTESLWEKLGFSSSFVSLAVGRHSGRKQLGAQVHLSALLQGRHSGRSWQVVTSHHSQEQRNACKHLLVCLCSAPFLHAYVAQNRTWGMAPPPWASHFQSQVTRGGVHLTGRTNQHFKYPNNNGLNHTKADSSAYI